jgi:2-succinyl-6-hydroxy-2,4-cyclohexadiene-1-carboxylate synthase
VEKAVEPVVPVVLLHGFTGSSASWGEALLAGLRARDRRVIALDLPGHGGRGAEPEAGMTLASTTDRVAAQVEGPFDLIGYSMGGRIALHVAHRFPGRVRRLVLESASPGLATAAERMRRRAEDETLAARIVAIGANAFASEWEANAVLRPAPARSRSDASRAAEIRRSADANGLAASLRRLGTGALPSLWEALPTVAPPTLLLVGADDAKFVEVARRMETVMPDAHPYVVQDAGHCVHLDAPDAWLRAVLRHLDR